MRQCGSVFQVEPRKKHVEQLQELDEHNRNLTSFPEKLQEALQKQEHGESLGQHKKAADAAQHAEMLCTETQSGENNGLCMCFPRQMKNFHDKIGSISSTCLHTIGMEQPTRAL